MRTNFIGGSYALWMPIAQTRIDMKLTANYASGTADYEIGIYLRDFLCNQTKF